MLQDALKCDKALYKNFVFNFFVFSDDEGDDSDDDDDYEDVDDDDDDEDENEDEEDVNEEDEQGEVSNDPKLQVKGVKAIISPRKDEDNNKIVVSG